MFVTTLTNMQSQPVQSLMRARFIHGSYVMQLQKESTISKKPQRFQGPTLFQEVGVPSTR
eukprot:1121263-Karenia_brevis.AAC.1